MTSQQIDYDAVDFSHFGDTAVYTAIICSTVSFMAVYMILYYLFLPLVIHPCFPHIKTHPLLHWKIADSAISLLHSLLIVILCIIIIPTISISYDIINATTTEKERIIASISIGYFIYDLIISNIIYSKKITGHFDYIYILHHLISICGLSICIITIYSGLLPIIGLFLNEITNPLLHTNNIKNYLTNPDIHNEKSVLLIDFIIKSIFLILYCVMRFVVMASIVYQIVFKFECSIYIQIEGILLLTVSVMWLPIILKDLSKVYSKYATRDNIENSAMNQLDLNEVECELEDEQFLRKDL